MSLDSHSHSFGLSFFSLHDLMRSFDSNLLDVGAWPYQHLSHVFLADAILVKGKRVKEGVPKLTLVGTSLLLGSGRCTCSRISTQRDTSKPKRSKTVT